MFVTEKMSDETKVKVRCDVLAKALKDLDRNQTLRSIYSGKVSESMVVVAEKNDLLIEDGGCVELSKEDESRLLDALAGTLNSNERRDMTPTLVDERIRIRCDILLRIIEDLGGSAELKAMFGGDVLERLYAVADGSDLKIESCERLNLSEDQTTVFLNILNEVIEDNTSA